MLTLSLINIIDFSLSFSLSRLGFVSFIANSASLILTKRLQRVTLIPASGLYRSWPLLIYSVKLSGEAQKSSKKISRKSGVKGDKMKAKALRDARKPPRREERDCARDAKRLSRRSVIGGKKRGSACNVRRERGDWTRVTYPAGRKRVVRMETRVYRVFLCSRFITVLLCRADLFSLFDHPPLQPTPRICICFCDRICIWPIAAILKSAKRDRSLFLSFFFMLFRLFS